MQVTVPVSVQGGGRREMDIMETANALVREARKMGLSAEAHDVVERFEGIRQELIMKSRELATIEAIAMESNDENIIDLREQLFLAVKLIHSDSIKEVMEEYDEQDQYSDYDEDCIEVSKSVNISRYDILERVRIYLNKRVAYKEIKELMKKRR